MRTLASLALAGLLAPVLVAGCSSAHAEPTATEAAASPTPVRTARVALGRVVPRYVATGSVRARNTATITSRAMGYVRTLEVAPGDRVRRGDLLATLDDADPRAGLLHAQAGSLEAEAALAEHQQRVVAAEEGLRLARTTNERMRAMRADESISQQAADESEAAFRIAEAELRAAQSGLARAGSRIAQSRAGVQSARANLEYSRVRAPFDGLVVARPAQLGDLASPAMPLFVVEQEGGFRVELTVPESLAGTLRLGAPLSVRVDAADASLQGTIGEIAPQVDAAARSVLVKVDLPTDAPPSLHAGMFARVSVPRPEVEALSVPADAVSSRGSLDRVFVVSGGVARLRLVTTGARHEQPEDGQPEDGPREVILSGLEAGEEVIVDPPSTLRDRDAVEAVR